MHDGTWAYFLFTWEDPTRSLKHLPLVKEADGWHLLHSGYEIGDEHDYNEDKFSVLLTTSDVTLAGDRTFHAGPHPVANAPATMTGRGLHFTAAGYVDVWQWKATSGGPTGWMDDAHFGPPLDPTPMQAANVVPYKGGFAPDPGTANYRDNFTVDADTSGGTTSSRLIAPLRLPKVVAETTAAMGRYRPRSHSRRERRRALVHDRSRIRALFRRSRRAHSDRHGDPRRHPGRRVFRRSRRRAMRRALGLRPLGARGGAPARHRQANTTCRSRAASSCGSRPSITARSDIRGMSAPFVSRWNNAKDLQGHRQRRAVSRQLRRPAARLGVDERRRPSARLPLRSLRRLPGAPRRRQGVRRPHAGRRHDPCLPGADRLRSRDRDRGRARTGHPAGARGKDRSPRARRRPASTSNCRSRWISFPASIASCSFADFRQGPTARPIRWKAARTIACCTFTSAG